MRALVVLAALAGAPVWADPCEERVADLQGRLGDAAGALRTWRWGWGLGGAGATAIQLGLVPIIDDRDTRIDLLVGAGSTLAILVPVLFPPEIDDRPATGDCAARRADAEARMQAAVDSVAAARSPWMHAGNVAFNVGVALLLGLGWGHWTSGIINGAVGIAVGEAELLTIPAVRF